MSELALYRKYRPQSFREVLGQDHIVSVLENEAKVGKISHAYLFSGSRGTGKTSIARIFAKSLDVRAEDVYEIDAASNRGIDEIRAIRDGVHTLPYSSKYKVYIVDEVHMLTKEAWNAFLKTLEEPPAHCLFIMATTEPHKLPDTVVSRCEHFAFKKPSHTALVQAITSVAKKENTKIEKSSVSLIATLAEGSFRDALSILQKIIHSSKDSKLSEEEVIKVLGAPNSKLLLDILKAIEEGDTEKGLVAIRVASEANVDMQVFLKLLLRDMRFVLLLRFAKDMKNFIQEELSEEDFASISELAKSAKNINSKTLLRFLEAYSQTSYSTIPELPLELAVIETSEKPHPRSLS